MAERDQKFVETIVREIVDYPDDVKVERTIDERGVLLTLSINPEDMGKIIGKEGRTAKALRTLLRVVGAKDNARVNLKILEPEGSEHRPPREISPAPSQASPDPIADVSETPLSDSVASDSGDTQVVAPIDEEEKATEII